MGGTGRRKGELQPTVRKYIEAVRDDRRALYDRLESVILGIYPDAETSLTYGIPTYWAKGARVGLGYRRGGVSFYPFGGGYLDEFRARYPHIQGTKGAINFKVDEKIPVAGLKKVIRRAIEHPMH
jgi:uncharacterized protein YdhG (YjbR/CyaY superfamily)